MAPNKLFYVELWENLNLTTLRRMFYFVTPSETMFGKVEDVPNYFDTCAPVFLVLIFGEMAFTNLHKGHGRKYPINDTLTSLTSGSFSMLFRMFNRTFGLSMYMYLYQHYRVIDLEWKANSTWYLGFLTEDLAYYLWHRALHEFGLFWAFHQMHHSSQYYNLSTAMRQGVIQEFASTLFELFQALFIPPQIYLVHRYLLLLNQVWVHTEWIPKLGPLEWFMNTPSHHRVHHGRNAYCLDKNYGGTLIIWDRMFGTFEEERNDEPVAYGLVKNYYTFDQLYLQFNIYKEMLIDKPYFELGKSASWLDRLKCYVLPIGWYPGAKLKWLYKYYINFLIKSFQIEFGILIADAMGKKLAKITFLWWRLEDTEKGIPKIEIPIDYHDPVLPSWFAVYVCFTYVMNTASYQCFHSHYQDYSTPYAALFLAYIIFNMQILGHMLEAKPWVCHVECVRLLVAGIASTINNTQTPIFTCLCYILSVMWMWYIGMGGRLQRVKSALHAIKNSDKHQ